MLFIVFPFPRGFFPLPFFLFSIVVLQVAESSRQFSFRSSKPSAECFSGHGLNFKLTDLLTRAIGMISMDIPWQVCIIMDSGFKIALEDVEIFPSICAWWEEEIDEAFQSDVVEVCFTLNCCGGADEQGDHRIIINHNTSLCSWLFLDTLFACMEFSLC